MKGSIETNGRCFVVWCYLLQYLEMCREHPSASPLPSCHESKLDLKACSSVLSIDAQHLVKNQLAIKGTLNIKKKSFIYLVRTGMFIIKVLKKKFFFVQYLCYNKNFSICRRNRNFTSAMMTTAFVPN